MDKIGAEDGRAQQKKEEQPPEQMGKTPLVARRNVSIVDISDHEGVPDADKMDQYLQIQYVCIFDDIARPTAWMKLTEDTMTVEYIVCGQTKKEIRHIPTSAIKEILVANQSQDIFWIAFHLSGRINGVHYTNNKYQIVLVSNGPLPRRRRDIFQNFYAKINLEKKPTHVPFGNLLRCVGMQRVLKIYWATIEPTKKDEEILQKPCLRPDREEPLFELQTSFTVCLAEGKTCSLPINHFLRSTRGKGWLRTDFVDIIIEHSINEKISQIPYWNKGGKTIHVFDTVFFQRLLKHENDLTGDFNWENYESILNKIYPVRGRTRRIPDFKKDALMVPVIYDRHWFLVVIQNPINAIFNPSSSLHYYKALEKDPNCPLYRRTCRMMCFDSLYGQPDINMKNRLQSCHKKTFDVLAGWLKLLILESNNDHAGRTAITFNEMEKVPVQPNMDDCGVYMLLFMKQMILENWSWMEIPDWEVENIDLTSDTFADQAASYRSELYDIMRRELVIDWPMFLGDNMDEEEQPFEEGVAEQPIVID